MEQAHRYRRAFQAIQKVACTVIWVDHPAPRIAGEYVACLFSPPVTPKNPEQLSTELSLDLDVDLCFVSKASTAAWTDAFSGKERTGSFDDGDYGWEDLLGSQFGQHDTYGIGDGIACTAHRSTWRSKAYYAIEWQPLHLSVEAQNG